VRRTATGDFTTEFLERVRFVPLIGEQGLREPPGATERAT
jgi:hypothetical protein